MFRITYEKHKNGNYHVTLLAISQTIILIPRFFKKIMGMKGNVLLGCCDISHETLDNLGFIFPPIL